jgi:EAL domain-containing protein (putative c-di-GMP-specific phosphodiesterase class I)
VLTDPDDAAIAKTIVALAQTLGLRVIAEGIETAAQRAFLASSGCHCYQGNFVSQPLPIKNFEQFVDNRGQFKPSPATVPVTVDILCDEPIV